MSDSLDLHEIEFCRDKDAVYEERDFLEKKVNFKLTTWFRLYEHVETTENRVKMRDVVIGIVKQFDKDTFISDHGTFISKLDSTAPYNFFLTTISKSEQIHLQSYSVTFHEIIDYTLGVIVDSLHINGVFDKLWVTTEYMLACQYPKMTVICNEWIDPNNEFSIPFDIDIHVSKSESEIKIPKVKLTIFKYIDNTIRIAIFSSILQKEDWQTRTNGIWISPKLPLLPENVEVTEGESPTNFKKDLIEFIATLQHPELMGWEALLYRTDFSSVKVFLITSIPGYHKDEDINKYGHRRLKMILSEHSILDSNEKDWPIIVTSAAIGTFEDNYKTWIDSNIVNSMSQEKGKKIIFMPILKLIFPTQDNFNESYDNLLDLDPVLYYDEETHLKQQWLEDHMYQWKSDKIGRTKSIPHINSYARISADESEMAWFLLTSANFGKDAWGSVFQKDDSLMCRIRNFELGILFIPHLMINRTTFPVQESNSIDVPIFPLPYDLPLTKYESGSKPHYCMFNKLINMNY